MAARKINRMPTEDWPKVILVERSFEGDSAFADMLRADGSIPECWFAAYMEHLEFFKSLGLGADVHMMLDVDPETCMKRLEKRSREEETKVKLDYLKRLKEATEKQLPKVYKIADGPYHEDDALVESLSKTIMEIAQLHKK